MSIYESSTAIGGCTCRRVRYRMESPPLFVHGCHCTGWRAKARLAAVFAPGRYAPSVVGTTYRLTAAEG